MAVGVQAIAYYVHMSHLFLLVGSYPAVDHEFFQLFANVAPWGWLDWL